MKNAKTLNLTGGKDDVATSTMIRIMSMHMESIE
jgi:hypothetical protein